MASKLEALRQRLKALAEARESIISESTAKKLERLALEESQLRETLESMERVESRAKHSIPPSAEEGELWKEIRRLSDEEAGILHQHRVPEKYIRADAVEHFAGDLKQRREEQEAGSQGMKANQNHGPRIMAKFDELASDEQTFLTKLKPLCLVGVRLFEIRQQKAELSAQRDELKAAREAAGLAAV